MKISRYTFCFEMENGEYHIYNTLSNALLKIDEISFNIIRKAQISHSELSEANIESELWMVLINKKVITKNDDDDFLIYKSLIMPLREQKDFMHLTLAPTMECNFNCFYCFEKEKPKGKISSETMDAIIKYVTASSELNKISLTWFGGEPLMAIPQMEQFYDKLHNVYHKEFDSNIITTGYYLTEEVIPILQRLKISSIQITLDGNKETHNKIKMTSESDDVFSNVLNNIDILVERAPEIHVVFRINLTKVNVQEYVPLYRYLSVRYKNKNVSVAPGFVENRGGSCANLNNNNYFFNRKDRSEFLLNLWENEKIYTPWLCYPSELCSECAIRDQQAISFDSEGYAYKCWEAIGQRKLSIGKITTDGNIDELNLTLLNRQLYGADPMCDSECAKCSYLPICNGGCPIQRIQNEFENAQNDVCTTRKDYLKEYIKIHIGLKKAGYDNHK